MSAASIDGHCTSLFRHLPKYQTRERTPLVPKSTRIHAPVDGGGWRLSQPPPPPDAGVWTVGGSTKEQEEEQKIIQFIESLIDFVAQL